MGKDIKTRILSLEEYEKLARREGKRPDITRTQVEGVKRNGGDAIVITGNDTRYPVRTIRPEESS